MTLVPGSRLGPYEIVAPIGAGGMGEVFRARDTKLNRDVAIKVLPAEFAKDHERVARFRREAQILASLNHSNIAAIYGIEENAETGVIALAMEYVDGEDLAGRLKRGAIPVDEAIPLAKQIAEALEEAHEHGVVHRDLKPANVKVTSEGKVKVLDFGLAKAIEGEAGTSSAPNDVSHSPTMTKQGTVAGMILGTAAYMSPEQARGKKVDKRADIWSFGVVLHEMLTGRRLFEGETVSDVLAAVLRSEIDWTALPAATPAELRRLLDRCLDRDPRNRLHDIADARFTLEEALRPDARTPASAPSRPIPRGATGDRLRDGAIVMAVTAAVVYGLSRGATPPAVPRPATTFGVSVPAGHALTASQSPLVDISEDGRTLVFVAEGEDGPSIFRRSFGSLEVTRLAGTVGAEDPRISPDGRSVAFVADKMLRRVAIEGGPAVDVASAPASRGVAWAKDGTLIFSPLYNSPLLRVSAAGGAPVAATQLDAARDERTHRWPQVLPDGRTVIFTVGLTTSPGDYDGANIDAVRLDTGERRTIVRGARMARYSRLGYLLYLRKKSLLAVRFDAGRLETVGEPFTVHEGTGGDVSSGSGYFAVSDDGVIALAPESATPTERLLTFVDRTGRETVLRVPPAAFNHPRVSPDGARLAFAIGGGSAGDDDIFTLDLRSMHQQRLTFNQGHAFPLWSLDGRHIVYTSGKSGDTGVHMRPSDGSGNPVKLLSGGEQTLPDAWLPDGKRLVVTTTANSIDLHTLELNGTRTPLIATSTAGESAAAFSPDGRFIAYTSTETGTEEVMVETYPIGSGRWQVSTGGGSSPAWSRDGKKLFYAVARALMESDIDSRVAFRASVPRVVVKGPYEFYAATTRNYDVAPDGRFVLVKRPLDSQSGGPIVVLDGIRTFDPGAGAWAREK